MAVDKLVDSAQLESDLTSVANAIRTKGGTSASLSFPSGFVNAIEAISGGGGGSAIFDDINVTEFTATWALNSYNTETVTHNLGETPDFMLLYPKNRYYPAAQSNTRIMQFAIYINIGMKLTSGQWADNTMQLMRLYENATGVKYQQYDTGNFFTNISSSSVTLGGVANGGVFPGDWILVAGTINSSYKQGQGSEYPTT